MRTSGRLRTLRTLITVGCFLAGVLILWNTFSPRLRPPETAQVLAPEPAFTASPVLISTAAPAIAPTMAPTRPPAPSATPLPTLAGAAPKGGDCPADHPIKGNMVDRGDTKGERIYHLPGDNGYAQTDPERCFVSAAEAELAGYRPVKK
jgi:hypothetical protein